MTAVRTAVGSANPSKPARCRAEIGSLTTIKTASNSRSSSEGSIRSAIASLGPPDRGLESSFLRFHQATGDSLQINVLSASNASGAIIQVDPNADTLANRIPHYQFSFQKIHELCERTDAPEAIARNDSPRKKKGTTRSGSRDLGRTLGFTPFSFATVQNHRPGVFTNSVPDTPVLPLQDPGYRSAIPAHLSIEHAQRYSIDDSQGPQDLRLE